MRAKEVIILIFIILAGVGLHYLGNLHLTVEDGWSASHFGLTAKPYEFEENLILEPADLIEIINSHGEIEIQGTDRSDISLTFKKTVWAKNEKKAQQVAEKLKLLTTKDGTRLTLTTNRNNFRQKNFSLNFTLNVPASISVLISNSFGPVRITKVKEAEVNNEHGQVDLLEIPGKVKASNSHERISLIDIGGVCQVETSHSPVSIVRIAGPVILEASHEEIELFDLKNSLKVTSRHSPIKALRLAGPSSLESSYEPVYISESGQATIRGHHSSIEIDNLTGQLEIESSYEPVKLTRINGDISLRGKSTEINFNSIQAGKIFIETSYEDVKLENFRGNLQLNLAHGDAFLSPASLDHNISASLQYGDLDFIWPAGQVARLEARSKGGRIHWELPVPPDENSTNGLSLVRAFQSSPATSEIKLSTAYGDIEISQPEAAAIPIEDERKDNKDREDEDRVYD
ncbi:MAG: DUF4097 family beta strand repeat-containing protein [Acidobacteriota bacterium]|nr:DUF4097 family beta strand repeat-containing protein [Acidobacteriota bacterium]